MKKYNDAVLDELIMAGKDATIELSTMKFKKQTPRMKVLLNFRRSQLNFIRKRAKELRLTEDDIDNIHKYVLAVSI